MSTSHDTRRDVLSSFPLSWIGWGLAALVNLLAIYVWGTSFQWRFSDLNTYLIFPVLGLIGFSTMWTHYIVDFIKTFRPADTQRYFSVTSWIVLAAILLHPGLLIYQRFRGGYGLPPHSYETYVAPGLGWITLLGSISLLIFLAYEFRRTFDHRPWWKYVLYLNDLAMLAIFYHGLRLGTQLRSGWFVVIWYIYGLSLVYVLAFKYAQKIRAHRAA